MSETWFQDLMTGIGEPPPVVKTLGFQLVELSPERGEVVATFQARPEFANLLGGVQGGFLAAMLDMSMSFALLASLPPGHLAPTLELKVSYLRPAPIGQITGSGRVVHRGGTIAFLAGDLTDGDGALLANASATVRIIRPS